MTEFVVANGHIYAEDGVIEQGYIRVANGKIAEVGAGDYKGDLQVIDAEGKNILPGFIDIHIHGGYGEDAMDASFDGMKHLSESLLSEGTTTYLATTMTQSVENIDRALENIVEYMKFQDKENAAEVAGVHLEGPFISEHKVGAQNPKYVQRPTIDAIQHFQEVGQGNIKVMTFAPEVEGAKEALEALSDNIIFSIGHTVAKYDEVNEAVAHGARHATHLYNAGTPFEHRAPGVFGAVWTNDEINAEAIVDGIHSHPAAIKTAFRMKGNQHFYLITDAMRAKGMPDGEYDLGGQNVIVKGSEARLASGALAGSILKMNDGVRNLMEFTGASLEEVWRTTSLNQAIALDIDNKKGSIQVGKDADLVIVDNNINVKTTIKNGMIHAFE
ncbi:N-acetylglucosamine-6-phosphate deacetylase [Staphylococcus carnosus]|uniref:N-acetylglucosamine-6-phosphate deacetylase n=1 Tax=Staphylococcus carnosus TaxID=1281 RepID=UPI0020A30366|nr:N-acetylglucosamine-6-phosphate deacetylase [Staphylococcus carnosus]UTB84603.1 N-acetylglucosamine-6-phosphate deacetylase [Staphylococcus carnosus]